MFQRNLLILTKLSRLQIWVPTTSVKIQVYRRFVTPFRRVQRLYLKLGHFSFLRYRLPTHYDHHKTWLYTLAVVDTIVKKNLHEMDVSLELEWRGLSNKNESFISHMTQYTPRWWRHFSFMLVSGCVLLGPGALCCLCRRDTVTHRRTPSITPVSCAVLHFLTILLI
jgi:hypothetical protein